MKRLVFKSRNVEAQNMPLFVKASLLKKCHQMNIRTDLAETGVYIFKIWILKMLEDLEKEHDQEISSIHVS